MRKPIVFDTAWQDLRLGLRLLVKNPGFMTIVVLSIAIGVGANAAMFSVADGLILRPLPVPDAEGIVTVSATTPTGEIRTSGISYPDFEDLRARARSFDGLAASRGIVAGLASNPDEPAQGRPGVGVSSNFFDVLRVRPALGRMFVSADDDPSGAPVVVLSHQEWSQTFGGDAGIVGRSVRLTGREFTVVGVMPEEFTGVGFYLQPAFYVPAARLPSLDGPERPDALERRDHRAFRLVGRLRPGVSLEQAGQEAQLIARGLEQAHPQANRGYGMLVRTETAARFGEFAPVLALGVMLISLAVAVLLVACANVAGLLTSRAPVRAREIAIRLAIGGSRARVARQLIVETVVASAAGGAIGLGLAYGGTLSFQQFQVATDLGVRFTFALDRRALAVGLGAAVLSALLASLAPAWRSTRQGDLSQALRGTRTPAGRAPRLWGRHGLVASQIALTLVMLTVGVSFYRAFEAEYGRGPGFRTDRILLATLDPSLARYDVRETEDFYRRLEGRVSAIPGVSSVGLTSYVPLSQDGFDPAAIVPDGYQLPAGVESLTVMSARVNETYFDTMGIPIVGGRAFEPRDTASAPRVAIVTRGMAARYWPDQDPVGRRILLTASNEWAEIVGVAADTKFRLFTSSSTPFLYLPHRQNPAPRATLLIATDGEPASVAEPLRTAVGEIDRDVPILGVRSMEEFYHSNARNLNTVVVRTIAAMGVMGLLLALVGLYGLMAYVVGRRTHEIGIRMAVGAKPRSVLRMILRQGALPSAAGIAGGVFVSAGAGRLIQGVFPGTGGDVLTYLLVVPVVAAVVTLAAYVPARRAARLDPLAALRHD